MISEICGITPDACTLRRKISPYRPSETTPSWIRATGVVDADDRAAGLHGEVHDLDDLLAEDLPERAAEDGEVLSEHAHLPAVDGAVAGHHAVAVRAVLLHAEGGRAVPGPLVELDEGFLVEELEDPLAGRLLALAVLRLDGSLGARVDGLLEAPLEVGHLARRRVDVDVVGHVRALSGRGRGCFAHGVVRLQFARGVTAAPI